MSRLIALYALALKLCPQEYRDQYGEPMLQTLEDMLADQPSRAARTSIWLQAMADLPLIASYQYAQLGGATMNQMPSYAKQSTTLSALLLLPFFILVGINIIHPLGVSWRGMAYIGIFILPVIALLIGILTLSSLATEKLSLSPKNLRQLASNWVLLVVPLLALLIVGFAFGHDSARCITSGSPSQILKCVAGSK